MVDFTDKEIGEVAGLRDLFARNQEDASDAGSSLGRNERQGSFIDDFGKEQADKRMQAENEILDRLSDVHESRSERAQELDESRRAEVTNDPEKWLANPDEYDYPNIDDPRTL